MLRDKYGLGKVIPSVRFEQKLVSALRKYLSILKMMRVDPPFFVMVSMLRVLGYNMVVGKKLYFEMIPIKDGIDRESLILPEVIMDSFEIDHKNF